MRTISHVIGFDDGPFTRTHRGDVVVIGTVCAGTQLDGVLRGMVRKDGANATERLARLVLGCRYRKHAQLVMLEGIALAGFNVVDIHGLCRKVGIPVLVVARRAPDMGAIRSALLAKVRGGARKWRLIERAGPMEALAGVYVQRAGLSAVQASEVVRRTAVHGRLPEPLRLAHLIATGLGGDPGVDA